MSTELFTDFNLDGDDSLINSLDSDTPTPVATDEATPAGTEPVATDDLTSELQDFNLDGDAPAAAPTTQQTQQPTNSEPTGTEEPVHDTTNKEDKDAPANNEVTSLYAPLASDLHKQGLLPNADLEAIQNAEDPQEALYGAVQTEIDKGIESFVTSLPDKFKEQLLAFQKGVDINTFQQAQGQKLELSSITPEKLESSVDLQKQIMKANLTGKGFSEEKATKYIENLESLNELATESNDALSEEVAKADAYEKQLVAEAEAARVQAQKEHEATIANLNKTIEETKEIIPGKALNKISRDKILSSMTQVAGKDAQGNPLNAVQMARANDPVSFEMKLHYLTSLGVFDGDWSAITKTAKTKAISDLDKKLQDVYTFNGNKNVKPGAPQEEGSSLLDLL